VNDNNSESFGVWAILELMGHTKLAGFVTEEKRFGSEIGRIDIPTDREDPSKFFTQYFGGQTIYRLTPCTEQVARAFALGHQPRPVYIYELALPEPSGATNEGRGRLRGIDEEEGDHEWS
jgi:hypothetical protein